MWELRAPAGAELKDSMGKAKEFTFIVCGLVDLVFNDFHFIFTQATTSTHMNIMWQHYNDRSRTGATYSDGKKTGQEDILPEKQKAPF